MKRYFSLILAIAATVSAQIVPSTGNVRGPTSATDNAVARYDGTTGKLIQNSSVTIDDSGNLTVAGFGDFQKSLTNITTEADYAVRIKPTSEDGGLYLGANSTVSVIQAIDPGTTFDRKLSLQPNGGNVLIGTTSDTGEKLQVIGTARISSFLTCDGGYIAKGTINIPSIAYASLESSGSVGYLTSYNGAGSAYLPMTYRASLHSFTQGNLQLTAYGAGTLTTDSSGNVTATSDERAKNISGTFTKGLAEVVKLTPKTYTWKPETGLNTTDVVASLTAQDLIAAGIPEAVSTYRTIADLDDDGKQKIDADGKPLTKRIDATYTVSDRTVIAALVNAVKELNAKVAALEAARN